MKYTLTAHLPKPRSGRNEKTLLRSQLKSISGTPISNLNHRPAKNMVVQALFIIWAPKWGSSPPRGPFKEKFQIFLSSSSLSMYKGPTMRIWVILANYSSLQDICCHFCQNLSPGHSEQITNKFSAANSLFNIANANVNISNSYH